MTKFLFLTTHYTERDNLYNEFCREFQNEEKFFFDKKYDLIIDRENEIMMRFLYLNNPELGLLSRYDKIDYITVLRDKNIPISNTGKVYLEKIEKHIKYGAKLITIEQAEEKIKELLKDGTINS